MFYFLITLITCSLITNAVRFGETKYYCLGSKEKLTISIIGMIMMYVWWVFLEPMTYNLGMLAWVMLSSRIIICGGINMYRNSLTIKKGELALWDSAAHLVFVILYQVIIK